MLASKDKERGTWKIYLRYVDWQGVKQTHTKRGFATKREALEYEREFLASKSRDLNMLFESFVEIYLSDLKPRIKYNTYLTKVHIIETKIIPYFAKKSIAEITAPDILQWQNELLKKSDGEGKQYSQTYLRTIQNQLNAILNHVNKYYGLTSNPAHKTTKMGKSKAQEMLFWTKEEYEKFAESVKSKPASYYAFEILYWFSTQNKLNFITGLQGLSDCLVYGLYVVMNSTLYDNYYRILNGLNQVNATEINSMPIPQLTCIENMGKELIKLKDMSEENCDEILGRFIYV